MKVETFREKTAKEIKDLCIKYLDKPPRVMLRIINGIGEERFAGEMNTGDFTGIKTWNEELRKELERIGKLSYKRKIK